MIRDIRLIMRLSDDDFNRLVNHIGVQIMYRGMAVWCTIEGDMLRLPIGSMIDFNFDSVIDTRVI